VKISNGVKRFSQNVSNTIKRLSRDSTPIESIAEFYQEEKEELNDDRESLINEIIDEIPKLSKPILRRSTNINPQNLKKLIQKIDQIPKPIEETKVTPEFHEFISKIIRFISHEIEVNKEDKIFQSYKHYHKKLIKSLKSQSKK